MGLFQYSEFLRQAFHSALDGQIEGIFAIVWILLGFAALHSLIFQLRIRRWPTTPGMLQEAHTAEWGGTEIVPSEVDYVNKVR